MPDTAPLTFELDPETAAALHDPATRARAEHAIRRTVRPAAVELAAYNAEGRDASPNA